MSGLETGGLSFVAASSRQGLYLLTHNSTFLPTPGHILCVSDCHNTTRTPQQDTISGSSGYNG